MVEGVQILGRGPSWTLSRGRLEDGTAVLTRTIADARGVRRARARALQEQAITDSVDIAGVLPVLAIQDTEKGARIVHPDPGGQPLSTRAQPLALDPTAFLDLAVELTRTLVSLHRAGLVVRTLDPSLMLRGEDGSVHWLGFDRSARRTLDAASVADPHGQGLRLEYVSPEQTGRMNRAVDQRSDLYALGVVLYEQLTGLLPFDVDDRMSTIHAHLARPPIPADVRHAQASPVLARILDKLLAKTAEERYQSARGLLADLEIARTALRDRGRLRPFPLARQDRSDQFRLPQQLFGRERELAQLLAGLDRAVAGQPQLSLVSGWSGIGKSRLILDVRRPLAKRGGYFVVGKSDQYRRDIPYASLLQAFRDLVQSVLAEPAHRLKAWRETLSEALAPNAQLVIDLIPEAAAILGPQPEVAEVSARESKFRLERVFQALIRAFARPKHPVVMFIDDLQWVDVASLSLLEQLLSDPEGQSLYVIGAYRSNEVASDHPMLATVQRLEDAGVSTDRVNLGPLSEDALGELIESVVGSEPEAPALSKVVLDKTGANPFFVQRFLRSLHEDGILSFDHDRGRWVWSLEAVRAAAHTDNVVDLMASRIQRLPDGARDALKLGAAVGATFDLDLAAVVLGVERHEAAEALLPAIEQDLLQLQGGEYPVLAGDERDLDFRFPHDRIQEAAYALTAEEDRPALHLQIARLLTARFADDLDVAFELVHHWGRADGVQLTPEDRLAAAAAYLRAASRSLASAAHQPALEFARSGVDLLPADAFDVEPELAVRLHVRLVESAYVNGEADLAQQAGEVVLERGRTLLDKVRVYELRIQHQSAVAMRMDEAVSEMLQVVGLLGMEITPIGGAEDLMAEIGRALGLAGELSDAQLAALPILHDPERRAAIRVIASSLPAAAMAQSPLHLPAAVDGVSISVNEGVTPYSTTPFAHVGIVLCAIGQYETGYRFGRIAADLAERFPNDFIADNVVVFGVFVQHWKESLSTCAESLSDGARRSLELGQITNYGYCLNNAFMYRFECGIDLESVDALAERWLAALLDAGQSAAYTAMSVWAQEVACLRGDADDATALRGNRYDSAATLPFLIENSVAPIICADTASTMRLALWFGDPWRALEVTDARWHLLETPSNAGLYTFSIASSLRALAQLQVVESVSDQERDGLLASVDAHRERLAEWARINPETHGSMHALVEAERAVVDGRVLDAQRLFDEAISLARLSGLQQWSAWAAECAAAWYQRLGRETVARAYALDALRGWKAWGAHAKVRHLRTRFDALLAETQASVGADLDVASLLEASEAISSQVVLDNLLHTLIEVVTSSAGAQRVVIVQDRDARLVIEAAGESGEQTQILGGRVVDESDALCPEIVQYVHRTGKQVLLHDATRDGRFVDTEYVRRTKPLSILCAPLSRQGRTLGVLYLENNLATHAFTGDRVRLLTALSAQAAIALENARLVTDLQVRSRELEAKNDQLRELDRLKDEFLAKTSHELRTPIHGIVGIAQSLLDGSAGAVDASIRHNLELVASSGRRLSNLVDDLLDLSVLERRETTLMLRPSGLAGLVEGVLALAKGTLGDKELELRNAVPEGLPPLMIDPDRVEQVLINLVGNAVKFTAEGFVEVAAEVVGGRVHVAVRDSGIGIAPEEQEHIFEAFEQANAGVIERFGGTGLGLSVSRELVQLHGGSLGVDSRLGEGSVFSFDLPLADEDLTMDPSDSLDRADAALRTMELGAPLGTQDLGEVEGTGAHILVVDDEPVNLQVVVNYLAGLGYRVSTAGDGTEALRRIEEGLRPAIVLLDVMMPGMDGFEVCRRLREDQSGDQLPVVMLTAKSQVNDVVDGLEAGANDYVFKPFSSRELTARIRTHLSLSGMHHAAGRFVPRDFLRLLGRDSLTEVELGDSVAREMTVLFSDIRAFSELSKGMTPEENFRFINAYFGVMEPVIVGAGGFIDKFIGDGIMALFDSADDAVRAGVLMQDALHRFNAERGGLPVRMGVGIHSGHLMLGTVGGLVRMDTTVISETVNLTARIESLTKRFGSGVQITGQTRDLLADASAFAMRRVDRISLDTSAERVDVFEVFDAEPETVRAARAATAQTFERALEAFYERRFDDAQRLFSLVQTMDPQDRAAGVYLERCRTILQQFTAF